MNIHIIRICLQVELRTSNSYVRESGGYRSVGYELHRITGSNLFLGKITKKKYYSRCACPTNVST